MYPLDLEVSASRRATVLDVCFSPKYLIALCRIEDHNILALKLFRISNVNGVYTFGSPRKYLVEPIEDGETMDECFMVRFI